MLEQPLVGGLIGIYWHFSLVLTHGYTNSYIVGVPVRSMMVLGAKTPVCVTVMTTQNMAPVPPLGASDPPPVIAFYAYKSARHVSRQAVGAFDKMVSDAVCDGASLVIVTAQEDQESGTQLMVVAISTPGAPGANLQTPLVTGLQSQDAPALVSPEARAACIGMVRNPARRDFWLPPSSLSHI